MEGRPAGSTVVLPPPAYFVLYDSYHDPAAPVGAHGCASAIANGTDADGVGPQKQPVIPPAPPVVTASHLRHVTFPAHPLRQEDLGEPAAKYAGASA